MEWKQAMFFLKYDLNIYVQFRLIFVFCVLITIV